jgi:transposase-like protein
MARAEKKRPTPHLRAVKSADTPPVAEGAAVRAAPAPATKAAVPVPQVSEEVATPRRRSFTAEFKVQVLAEVDACTELGEVGALLRRHGLYSSHLAEWRRARNEGALSGLAPRKRGRKPVAENPLAAEVARLERENKKLVARAVRAEGLVAVQKKLADLLGEELPSEEELFEAERKGLPIPPPRRKR